MSQLTGSCLACCCCLRQLAGWVRSPFFKPAASGSRTGDHIGRVSGLQFSTIDDKCLASMPSLLLSGIQVAVASDTKSDTPAMQQPTTNHAAQSQSDAISD